MGHSWHSSCRCPGPPCHLANRLLLDHRIRGALSRGHCLGIFSAESSKARWEDEVAGVPGVGFYWSHSVCFAVFLFGLNSRGNAYPWDSAGITLAPLILGLVMFLGSFIYDFIFPKDPLFPWYLFKKFGEFSSLLALVFVAGMVFFAASALNAQTILYLYTPDPIQIGIYSIPSGYGLSLVGILTNAH
jgi:hypothetical protein